MRLQDVTVTYAVNRGARHVRALSNVSLQIAKGENVGVIGRNGSGKSTLMKVMAGVIRPDEGSVDAEGASVSLLTLQAGFDPNLSGYRNILVSGLLLGLRKSQIDRETDGIAELSGLGDALSRPVSTYSTGMKSRLGFSIAVQLDPDILLVDEVLSVGDQDFRARSEAILLDRFKSDRTVMFVSHQLASVRKLCPRTIWLDEGVVKMDGDTEEVLPKYVEAG